MTEENYLQHCLFQVEKKLNWKKSSFWKESDYLKLSEIIFNASEISISAHTLKRLFGKIKYKENYNPQQATKDALSIFLGYASWKDFVQQYQKSIQKKESNIGSRQKKIAMAMTIVTLMLLFVAYNIIATATAKEKDVFLFDIQDSIGTVPFTVHTKYDFSETISDSLFIDFDFVHPVTGEQIKKTDKNRFAYNFTYQIPGYYKIQLRNHLDTLKTKNILAMSKEWESYLVEEGYRNRFWMDTKISTKSEDNYLHFSVEELKKSGLQVPQVFFIVNRFFKNTQIDGDNFELKTKFKNGKATGGITCYDFILNLYCMNNLNSIKLMEDGCSQYSGIKFGENNVDGTHENLSAFSIKPDEWNTLFVRVNQKEVTAYVNEALIYKGKYNNPNGSIVGIENIFKGSGMLDYIEIKDLKTGKTFFDDFD